MGKLLRQQLRIGGGRYHRCVVGREPAGWKVDLQPFSDTSLAELLAKHGIGGDTSGYDQALSLILGCRGESLSITACWKDAIRSNVF